MSRQQILAEVSTERDCQDAQWGGPAHDDRHGLGDWVTIACRHLGLACGDDATMDPVRFRKQMIRLAAISVAAVEALDRRVGNEHAAGPVHTGSGW